MGSWYELVLTVNLKADVPQQIVDILRYITLSNHVDSPPAPDPTALPAHPFFSMQEWDQLLWFEAPVYFPGETFVSMNRDEISELYKFTLRAMYPFRTMLLSFLHWLAPYSETAGFVGYLN